MFRLILTIIVSGILLVSISTFAGQGKFKVSVSPVPPDISATVSFSEPSGNNILDAEEMGKLVVTVKNNGRGDAFDVKAEITAERNISGVNFDREVSVGTIPPGQSVKKEIELTASEDLPTADVKFSIHIKEANGFDAEPLAIVFRTKSFEPPKLVVADIGIDDQNGNSRIEPMENVELTARIQNAGYGDARGVAVDVLTGNNVFVAGDGVTHFDLGGLPAGKFKDVKFIFYTNKQIKNAERIPIEIKISEARPRFKTAKALDFTMNAPQKRTEEIVVKGIEEPKGGIELAGGLSVDVDMNVP